MSFEKRLALAFYGFIRTFNHPNEAPQSLVLEMMKFYQRSPPFEWDASKKGSNITLSNANKTATKTADIWNSVLCTSKLNAGTMSAVHWELTLRERRCERLDSSREYMAIMMGFVNGDDYGRVRMDNSLGCNEYGKRGTMLNIYSGNDRFKKFINGSQTELSDIGHKARDCKVGDRFEIELDFVAKRATAFYNGLRIGLITDALPTNVYLALSLFQHVSVETTKFEITYK